ncbi:MAG TPA: periplasmic heavy metal sensor [Myxococcota bacterium]|nr:periplasmic heavy metal sensor [Myxococcota bacterium]
MGKILFDANEALSPGALLDAPPRFGEPSGEAIERYAAELGIPEATAAQIHTLTEEHRTTSEAIVKEVQTQKRALREKLNAAQPNEAEVIALARTIGALETDLSVARLTSMVRIRALLTPDQNEALQGKSRGGFEEPSALFDQAAAACEEEIAKLCPEADGPPGHAMMCLLEQRRVQQITPSTRCEEALRELPPHFILHGASRSGDGGQELDVVVPPPGAREEEE